MVTQTIIDYLRDDNVSFDKKKLYLERLNLNYSDLFELRSMFEGEPDLHHLIHGLLYYYDSKLNSKINRENKKLSNNHTVLYKGNYKIKYKKRR